MLLGTLLPVSIFCAEGGKNKTIRAKVRESAELNGLEKGTICEADSGIGQVLEIIYHQENPLFPSVKPNMVHAYLGFPKGILAGKEYRLPHPDVVVCYFEKGDLLMFHTFQAEGSVRFDAPKSGKPMQSGEIDLKFVKPHHNMSNADYHYVGGDLKL